MMCDSAQHINTIVHMFVHMWGHLASPSSSHTCDQHGLSIIHADSASARTLLRKEYVHATKEFRVCKLKGMPAPHVDLSVRAVADCEASRGERAAVIGCAGMSVGIEAAKPHADEI